MKIFSKPVTLSKAIKGNDPAQINIFGKPIAGAEKEFAPGDKRKLEIVGSGKLRWKNADKEEDRDEKIIKEYSDSPVSEHVDRLSKKAQEILNNVHSADGKRIADDLWNICDHIKQTFVEKINKHEKITDEDIEGVKSIVDNMIEGAIEEIGKKENKVNIHKPKKINQKKNSALAGLASIEVSTKPEDVAARMTMYEMEQYLEDVNNGDSANYSHELYEAVKKKHAKLLEVDKKKQAVIKPNPKIKDWIRQSLPLSYRPLQEGEESVFERKYKAYKELKFYAAHETIKTADDVAYIFNQLQDEAVEHCFVAHETEKHGIIVQHISTGNFNSSLVSPSQIWDAINRFGTTKLHFVHNHPSGNLDPSNEDQNIWLKIKDGLPKDVVMMPAVIIDAREGSYGFFEPHGSAWGHGQLTNTEHGKNAKNLKAFRFSRQIFNKNATISQNNIHTPEDIVEFVYKGRFTLGDKAQVLSLNSRNSIVGRFNLTSSLDNSKETADEIAVLVGRSGGVNSIVMTNKDFEDVIFRQKLNSISEQLKIKDIGLFDCLSIKNGTGASLNWKSAVAERVFEKKAEYMKSIFKNFVKAFGAQVSLFEEPYSKEGQTKEGKGGTLQLKRDEKGKGAHWRFLNKKESGGQNNNQPEEKSKGKTITPAQSYDMLQDKLGNKAFVTDNDGNLLDEGTFQLINENSDGNYSLFLKEKNGFDSVINVPKNQSVLAMEGGVQYNFSDKNITISTEEKSQDQSIPVEMERAKENAERAKSLEKMRNYNRYNEKAEDFADLGKGQKSWFFRDLEDVANALNLEFSNNNKIIKKQDALFKEIRRNADKYGEEAPNSALIGAFAISSPYKINRVIGELKDKGYAVDGEMPDKSDIDRENFFVRIKIKKGDNDPCPKELQFASPDLAKAAEDCAKKPNALRETEFSLKLKVVAEAIPEYSSIKKKLFSEAGDGIGQLYITGGLPGSGKSSVLGHSFNQNKVVIDPDAIKYMIADERGIGKEEVDKKPWELHEDSSVIAKHLIREAVREGKDVVYDTTMKGEENLRDLLEIVKYDTFQINAKFIHIPLKSGIERDKARGQHGGRSIGTDLYKKEFGDYQTHKAFFQLKEDFDNFDVFDNSAPLGEGVKLFYQKIDGREKIHHPDVHKEFHKIGSGKIEKSLPLGKPDKSGDNVDKGNGTLTDGEKIKMLAGFPEDHELDPEQDFFELGLLCMHGLIDENMILTPEGEAKFEKDFGDKFSPEEESGTDFNSILNPKKNIADKDPDKK
jgi:DNA repair protein RadC